MNKQAYYLDQYFYYRGKGYNHIDADFKARQYMRERGLL